MIMAAVLIAIVLLGGLWWFFSTDPLRSDTEAVQATVLGFGAHMRDVSLLAPDAGESVAEAYAPYVAEELLVAWQQAPRQAPGRLTSSPWPDHATIASVNRLSAESFSVNGAIVEMTSSGEAGSYPFTATVRAVGDGKWLISEFMGYPPTGGGEPAATLQKSVTYRCDGAKTIAADYYVGPAVPAPMPNEPPVPTGSVKVAIGEEPTTTLMQTISADGVRYANADESLVFWSKGNEALVMRNNVMDPAYANCTEQGR